MTRRGRTIAYVELATAARLAHVPPARVRRYVRAGLLSPSRAADGREVFGDAQIARLRRIRRLADDLGLTSAGIEVVLRLLDQIETLQRELDARHPAGTEEVRTWQ